MTQKTQNDAKNAKFGLKNAKYAKFGLKNAKLRLKTQNDSQWSRELKCLDFDRFGVCDFI